MTDGYFSNLNIVSNDAVIEVHPDGQFDTYQEGSVPGAPSALLEIHEAATLTNEGAFNIGSGSNGSGATLVNDGSITNKSYINNYAKVENTAGEITNYGGHFINLGTVDNQSTFSNENDGVVQNRHHLKSSGEIDNMEGARIENLGYATNFGTLSNDGIISNASEAELINESDGRIENAPKGSIGNSGILRNRIGGEVVNRGEIKNYAFSVIDNQGWLENVAGDDSSFGHILNLGDDALFRNRGTIVNVESLIENDDGATIANQFGTIENSGIIATDTTFKNLTTAEIDNTNGAVFNYCDGIFRNDGTIDNLFGDGLFNASGTVMNNGTILGPGFLNGQCSHLP